MNMSTNYQLMDELTVSPIQGLDGAHGLIRIVAVTCFEALPTYIDGEVYLCGDDRYDDETRGSAWYGFRYLDEADHELWGVCYLPEDLLHSMIQAAASTDSAGGRWQDRNIFA